MKPKKEVKWRCPNCGAIYDKVPEIQIPSGVVLMKNPGKCKVCGTGLVRKVVKHGKTKK